MAAVDPFRPGEIDHNLIENRAGAAAPKRGVVVPGQTVFCLIGEIDSPSLEAHSLQPRRAGPWHPKISAGSRPVSGSDSGDMEFLMIRIRDSYVS